MASLRFINLKIDRAEKHLNDLQARIEQWTEAQTGQVVQKHDPKTGWHELWSDGLPEPPDEWVAILGDYAANLRASLEYVIEALVLANGGAPHSSNKFPIFSLPEQASGLGAALRGVAPEPYAVIELLQPYQSPNRAQPEPLEVLANLANKDKHHRPHAVTVWTTSLKEIMAWEGIGYKQTAFRFVPLDPCQVVEFATIGRDRLVNETPLWGLRVDPPDAKVDMYPGGPVDIDVAFANGRLVRFWEISNLIVKVRAVVDLLKPWLVEPGS